LRAKFTNDSFVCEVGRGSGVLERSLEIAEVLRGEEGDDEDRNILQKGSRKFISSIF